MLILEYYPSWAGKPAEELRSAHIDKQEDINGIDWMIAKGNGSGVRIEGNFVKVGKHSPWIIALVAPD